MCREVVVHEPLVGPREEIDVSESSDRRQASKRFSEVGVDRGPEKVSAGGFGEEKAGEGVKNGEGGEGGGRPHGEHGRFRSRMT